MIDRLIPINDGTIPHSAVPSYNINVLFCGERWKKMVKHVGVGWSLRTETDCWGHRPRQSLDRLEGIDLKQIEAAKF